MSTLKKMNYILDGKQKIQLAGILIMIVIGSVLELLGVSAILPLINVALNPEIISQNEYYIYAANMLGINEVSDFIKVFSILLCIIYVVKSCYLVVSKNIQLKFSYELQRRISIKLMDSYLHEDYLFHVSHNVSELQRNIQSDVSSLFLTISAVMNLLVELITCLLLVGLLLVTDITTTTLLVGILSATLFIFWLIYRKIQVNFGKRAREARAQSGKWLLQSFAGIKEIKVMNREEFFLRNYNETLKETNIACKNANVATMLPKYIIEPLCICSMLLTIYIRMNQGKEIEGFVMTLSIFAAAAIRMLPSFNRLTEYMGNILYNKASVDNVFADLKEAEELEQHERRQKYVGAKLDLNHEICVKNINFSYPKANKKIFSNASVTIYKNEAVAFVGSSGAGKTTLADIIIGLLKPEKGSVYVDETDVYECLDAWHASIGYIPQMIYLMDDTIRSNVVFGIPEEEIDDEKVWKALEKAELADFVKELADGLYTEVGDRGVRLSGGQRQRIGIARALYKEPSVLILDEATSALDNETEAAVMESIESLQGKTTMIIIAHRLTTIQNCDKVYEVEHGEITLNKKKD
ncbi:MAG: ABC transporter ATP-binding protein [Lachnospiraceae bacterium]|nr:ABC transporter ATP-binding protein [Lachnospiraceae bacterium]